MLVPRHVVVVGIGLVGACAYRAGSFRSDGEPFDGSYVSVECLDVAVERGADLADGSPVVDFTFGNRCGRPAMVDLAGPHVVGRTTGGERVELTANDHYGRLRPLHLDARATAHESITYSARESVSSVCVDVAGIAHAGSSRWLCLSGRAL